MAVTTPAASISPAVVALLSDQWKDSGEIYVVGGGHVDHLFLAQTLGITEPTDWAPEAMIEHAEQLTNGTNAFIPKDLIDTARHIMFTTETPPKANVSLS